MAAVVRLLLRVFGGIAVVVVLCLIGLMVGRDGKSLSGFGQVLVGFVIVLIIIYLAVTGQLFTH